MNKKLVFFIIQISILVLLSNGCMSTLTGGTYSRSETRTEQTVRMGTVISVSDVTIDGTKGAVGAITGGAAGAAAGHQIGKGEGKIAATAAGAIAGALTGASIERKVTKKPGVEITVKLDDGDTIAVIQEKDPSETFVVGDRVRVLKSSDGTTRVRK